MIDDVQRDRFLANPNEFARLPCLAVAAVAGDDAEETAVLKGWAFLKERLNGIGARTGYRAFLAMLQDNEANLRSVVGEFSEQKSTYSRWRFVVAPISQPERSSAVLQEIEWLAYKEVQYPERLTLKVVGADSAL